MSDILSNTNWGATLLPLVARGNSIICEISRLSEHIPPVFRPDNVHSEFYRYQELLSDFTYFSTTDYFENKIETSSQLQDLDDEFRENHLQILERFYRVFESVYKYVSDLNQFLQGLDDGLYVQHDLVSVLMDEDGKQLMCEALYLYGVMLLLIDQKIPGPVRERMLVSFYRYCAKRANNTDDVCKLLRSSGYFINGKRPSDYPEAYFRRVPINAGYIDMVIDKLRSDDLYHQLKAYPRPEHRSTARSTQAAMLYVCLFFAPEVLTSEPSKMREIVDKHFPDNWVIAVHMGHVVNLVDAWQPYKAAITALNNTVDLANVKLLCNKYVSKVKTLRSILTKLLKEGILEPEYVLDNINKLMDVVRDSNVTIRWLMLHSTTLAPGAEVNKKCRQLRDVIVQNSDFNQEAICNILILSAQFEFKLGEVFQKMLANKEINWNECKKEGIERMTELSEVFSGTKALTRIEKNEKLQKWFTTLGEQINNLTFTNSTSAGRKLDQLVQALHEVLEYHQLESNVMVKQFIGETCRYLQQMLRVINLQDEVIMNLNICADISYALNIIDSYTVNMQNGIMKDPFLVIKLRATFLKLAASQDLPLIRLNQCNSKDLLSVTEYYSSELVQYVRKVLQIIPQTMFVKLAAIIDLQTTTIKELPTRLDKDKLKDFAFLDERFKVAKLTHDISVFTEGILMMKTTLVGIIEIDPHKLLEDGIRKELVLRVSKALHEGLIFNPKAKSSELVEKLQALGQVMDGFRRSFEYIQDYVSLYGLKIWKEEVSRIINYNVELECNALLRNKVHEWQSIYQSKTIPIPHFPSTDQSATFIGRLVKEILRVTDPKSSIYIEQLNTWHDAKTKQEVVNIKTFQKLQFALNSFGLSSIDKVFGYMIVRQLQSFLNHMQNIILKDKRSTDQLETFQKQIRPITGVASLKVYSDVQSKLSRQLVLAVEIILKIGQLQLIRRHIANQLELSCKFEGKFLFSALEALNNSLLLDIADHFESPDTKPYPWGEGDNLDTDVLYQVNKYLETGGIHDPFKQVYVTTKRISHLAAYSFLIVISCFARFSYLKSFGALVAKRVGTDNVDGVPLMVGMVTLFQQFHPDIREFFLALIGQYIRSNTTTIQSSTKGLALPSEVVHGISFMLDFTFFAKMPKDTLQRFVPEFLIQEYKALSTSTA